mmetsp:Transcript_61388/g.143586  ORF Transcript_61388/g.143586 Transcript_61388/m.143586 type:complete len:202 (+) Transcript_61388:1050-1655(+)
MHPLRIRAKAISRAGSSPAARSCNPSPTARAALLVRCSPSAWRRWRSSSRRPSPRQRLRWTSSKRVPKRRAPLRARAARPSAPSAAPGSQESSAGTPRATPSESMRSSSTSVMGTPVPFGEDGTWSPASPWRSRSRPSPTRAGCGRRSRSCGSSGIQTSAGSSRPSKAKVRSSWSWTSALGAASTMSSPSMVDRPAGPSGC